ncbi:hypothetical protein N0V82_010274 [Gnomoniopsis sp. IMI 355080]|nr:hypothetical protein N0V82_010274 [Gnomoniopsis sp. IMI 355080]
MPEDCPPDVAGMVSDTPDEEPDDTVPEGAELIGRVSEKREFLEAALERGVDNGKPELARFDEVADNGPDVEVLDKGGPLVTGNDGVALDDRAVKDVEFQMPLEDCKPEEGRPEEGKFDTGPEDGTLDETDDDDIVCFENDETKIVDVEDRGSPVDEAIGDVVGDPDEDAPPVIVPLLAGSGVGPTPVVVSDVLEDPTEKPGLETDGVGRELKFTDNKVDGPVINGLKLELEPEPGKEGEGVTSTLRKDSARSRFCSRMSMSPYLELSETGAEVGDEPAVPLIFAVLIVSVGPLTEGKEESGYVIEADPDDIGLVHGQDPMQDRWGRTSHLELPGVGDVSEGNALLMNDL